jgi:pimeloyl-ACP methyl ester carboxylesterase
MVAQGESGMAASESGSGSGRTFVLIHGAWHGGWCWGEVASLLRGRGHRVHTPTQTGLGERRHLLSRSITLDTFVDDIANVLIFEDLHDVILVGHSFGGNAVSGVADRMPVRIRKLVYLDSIVLEGGQSPFGVIAPDLAAARIKAAEESSAGLSLPVPPPAAFGVSDAAHAEWLLARMTPHPLSTFQSTLKLTNPVGNGCSKVYVRCADPIYPPLQPSRDYVAARGWRIVDIATGHDAMVSAPRELADLLEAEAT